ncbi:MAG: T9SS type A sorting domain-containing protein [Flavobacteriales bacterium]
MLRSFLATPLMAGALLATGQATYDAKILEYTGLRYSCEGSGTPVLKIQNAGTATMGTCVVETWKNGLMVNSFNWILAVPALTGDVRQPVLPVVPELDAGDVLEFRIISVNDQPDEDADGNILSVLMDVDPAQADSYLLNVVVNMSTPPDQLVWTITGVNGQPVAQGGPYTSDGLLEYWVELQPDACYMVRLAENGDAPSGDGQLTIFAGSAVVADIITGTVDNPARAGLVTGLVLSTSAIQHDALAVYPSPASETVRISLPNGYQGKVIRVHDAQGRLVMEVPIASADELHELNVGSLPAGVYVVEATGRFAIRAKLVVEH